MEQQYSQIKLNLSTPLKTYIAARAKKFGVPMAGYVKHLILKDIEQRDFPTFAASNKAINAYKRATGPLAKTIKVTGDVEDFIDTL